MLIVILLANFLLLNPIQGANDCPEGCLACQSPLLCTDCDLQLLYYLKNGLCAKSRINKCVKINSNGKCIECKTNNYLFRNAVCINVVSIDFCEQYDSTASTTICLMCNASKILFQNRCLAPINFCVDYDVETGFCIECQIKYKLSVSWKQCLVGLIRNCNSYDRIGYCTKCNEIAPRLSLRREACLPMIPHCSLHSSMQNLCLECEVGFLRTTDNQSCFPEISGCEIYADSSLATLKLDCVKCKSNFLKIQINSEASCKNQLINCRNFDSDSKTCIFCKSGFTLTDDSLICLANIPNCDRYQHSTFSSNVLICSLCKNGYHLNLLASDSLNSCAIDIQNCLEYNERAPEKCSLCSTNFIISEDNLSCVAFIKKCNELAPISSANPPQCQKCADGFRLSKDSLRCPKIIDDCVLYSDDENKCSQCVSGKRMTNDGQLCLKEIQFCRNYSYSDVFTLNFLCEKCIDDYLLVNENTKCVRNIFGCAELDLNNFEQCKNCLADYILTEDKHICFSPIANCEIYFPFDINSGKPKCQKCFENFELLNNNQICSIKIEGCSERTQELKCNNCIEGLELTNDMLKCLPAIANCFEYEVSFDQADFLICSVCVNEFEIAENGKRCLRKIVNCEKRNNETFLCESCIQKYWLGPNSDFCYPIIENCEDHLLPINIFDEMQCKKCKEKFELFLDSHFCVPIIEKCKKRNEIGFYCLECELGFILSQNGFSCLQNIANCAKMVPISADDQNLKCVLCKTGYDLKENEQICVKSIIGCIQQDQKNYLCTKCENDKFPTTDGLSCLPIIPNCHQFETSSEISETLFCKNCQPGFELSSDLKNCYAIVDQCQTRDPETHFCKECVPFLVLTDDSLKCLPPIENCFNYLPSSKEDTQLRCETCDRNFVAIGNGEICAPKIENCLSRNVLLFCTECANSLVPTSDGKKCLQDIPHCQNFEQSTLDSTALICLECKTPFLLKENSCKELSPISNCATQDNSSGFCLQCSESFAPTSDSLFCLSQINGCSVYRKSTKASLRLFCDSCQAGKVPTSDGTICLPEISNCEAYGPSNEETKSLACQRCREYFELTGGVCVRNGLSNCLLYNPDTGNCDFCDNGFFQTDDLKFCLTEIEFCVEYNPSDFKTPFLTCKTCFGNFIMTDDHRRCNPPIRFCLEYLSSSVNSITMSCAKCNVLYLVQPNGTCQRKIIPNCRSIDAATAKCTACLIGFVLTTDAEKCLPEVFKCLTYLSSDLKTTALTCKECVPGATLAIDNSCYDGTIAYCIDFDKETKICNSCDRGKLLTSDKLKCLDPILNCQEYEPSSLDSVKLICKACKTEYQIFDQGNLCGRRVNFCEVYDPLTFVCKICIEGYQVTNDNQKCLQKIANCAIYDFSSNLTPNLLCLQCTSAFMPADNRLSCIDKVILNCEAIDSVAGLCNQCKTNYRLTDDKEICLSEVENCKIYQESSKFSSLFQCLQCRPGYQLIALSCILRPIAFCEVRNPNNGLCQTCIDGRRVTDDSEICLDDIENCAEYASSNKNTENFTCLQCKDGNFFIKGNCATTIANCIVYDERYFFCIECQKGFSATSDGEKCLKSIENCFFYFFSTRESAELTCQFCENGFEPTDNGKSCSHKQTPLATAKETSVPSSSGSGTEPNISEILQCEKGWQLTDDKKKCLPKIDDCLIYVGSSLKTTQYICLKCAEGFSPGLNGETCLLLTNK